MNKDKQEYIKNLKSLIKKGTFIALGLTFIPSVLAKPIVFRDPDGNRHEFVTLNDYLNIISDKTDTPITADDTILYGDTSDSDNLKKDTVQGILDLVPGTNPAGNDGDLQINNSGVFGTLDGLNLDKTGNARGTNSLDIQAGRSSATQVASGDNCTALGSNNTTSSNGSDGQHTAVGYNNTTSSSYYGQSTAVGASNTCSSYYGQATAMGNLNTASGDYATAIGYDNEASDHNSVAVGTTNEATSREASAIGVKNKATGLRSSAIGYYNRTESTRSSGVGYGNIISGKYSTGVGYNNKVFGESSVAIGNSLLVLDDETAMIGTPTNFVYSNANGFTPNNFKPLASIHSTGDVLVTDIKSLGAELVTNGTFDSNLSGWTVTGTWVWNSALGGYVRKVTSGVSNLSQSVPITVGKYYLVSFVMERCSVGDLEVSFAGENLGTFTDLIINGNFLTVKMVVKASTTDDLLFHSESNNYVQYLDSISVKEITGGDVLAPLGKVDAKSYSVGGVAGFNGTGSYTNFTIVNGIITNAS